MEFDGAIIPRSHPRIALRPPCWHLIIERLHESAVLQEINNESGAPERRAAGRTSTASASFAFSDTANADTVELSRPCKGAFFIFLLVGMANVAHILQVVTVT